MSNKGKPSCFNETGGSSMERYLADSLYKERLYQHIFKGGHRCYDAINIGDIYK